MRAPLAAERAVALRSRDSHGAASAARCGASTARCASYRLTRRATSSRCLQYTSGSTGDPKGVMLTHANLLANVRAIGEALSVRPDDVGVSWLPLYHDMGLIGAWLMPLYFGLPVVVLSPVAFLTRPERWLRACHRYRGTLTAAPNFAYELAVRRVADADIEGLDLSSLRAALNGAEPVNPETLERFASRFARSGLRREALTPVYGLAEASLAVTIPPMGRGPLVDRVDRDTFARTGRAVPVAPDAVGDLAATIRQSTIRMIRACSRSFPWGGSVPGYEIRLVTSAGHDAGEREASERARGRSAVVPRPFRDQRLFRECQKLPRLSFRKALTLAGSIPVTAPTGWATNSSSPAGLRTSFSKRAANIYPHEVEELASQVAGVRKGCVVAFGAADAASGTERLVIVAETRERGPAARRRSPRRSRRRSRRLLACRPTQSKCWRPTAFRKLPAAS